MLLDCSLSSPFVMGVGVMICGTCVLGKLAVD